MPMLLRSPTLVLEHHAMSGFVRLARTELAFASIDDAGAAIDACIAALAHLDHGELGILHDLRRAPRTGDPKMQKFLFDKHRELDKGFARVAILVGTTLGQLQMGRINRQLGAEYHVSFSVEREAIDYVMKR